MACGDKYRSQIVTVSGLTLDDPQSWLGAGFSDYEEWRELARAWSVEANARLNVLGKIEETKGEGFSHWNELVPLNNRMQQRYKDLPGYLSLQSTYNTAVAIGQAQQVIFDAACLMEQADDFIEGYGYEVPKTPGFSRSRWWQKLPWWGWTIIGTGAVVTTLGVTLIGLRELRLRGMRKLRGKNPRRRRRKLNMELEVVG